MHSKNGRQLIGDRRYLLLVLLLVIILYVLVPQIGEFRASWHLLGQPVAGWTVVAIGLSLLTYLAAAATYCLLAFKPLPYGQTLIVELAAMFVNRLLPGGIGALGTNYTYLRHKQHTAAQAAALVGMNNLIGVVGHAVILAAALIVAPTGQRILPNSQVGSSHWLRALIIGGVAVALLFVISRQHRLRQMLMQLLKEVATYRRRLWRVGAGLVSSMTLTLSNILCLTCCSLALGVHLPFVVILLVFSFGLGSGTVTPTPGGLGGFEAGLTAALIVYHVASPAALAIALLYRLISYWLPLVIGAPALLVAQKRRLFVG